ncbi:MAG: hypothetical protein IJW43_04475 [Clostridia bacterium]|nr:hypothetical protein [Clostridia bacterium]
MLNKIIALFFEKKNQNKMTILSKESREVKQETIKKTPRETSGVYGSFREREMFYQQMFTVYSQQ